MMIPLSLHRRKIFFQADVWQECVGGWSGEEGHPTRAEDRHVSTHDKAKTTRPKRSCADAERVVLWTTSSISLDLRSEGGERMMMIPLSLHRHKTF